MTTGPIQIVLDTNVLLSALRSRLGASFRLLSLIGDPRFTINLSVPLILEYVDVLKRKNSGLLLSHEEIDDVLDFFVSECRFKGDILSLAASTS